MRRTYSQYCAVARALDRVGDRWVLLLVRELLSGPKRFKELSDALEGMGANLLTARLRDLEADGIIERAVLRRPQACAVYSLTERGRALEPVVLELARWGAVYLGPWNPEQTWRPHWGALVLKVVFRPEAASGVHETYQFEVDGELFHARVEGGSLVTGQGPAADAVLRVRTDTPTFLAIASGRVTPEKAARAGVVNATGEPAALRRLGQLFGMPPAAPEPAAVCPKVAPSLESEVSDGRGQSHPG